MISTHIKLITVDGFYDESEADRLCCIARPLQFVEKDFGYEIENFNMVPENADQMFSTMFNSALHVIDEQSGVFRIPKNFIHFEEFDTPNEWMFVCALEKSFFTVYEHLESKSKHALDKYQLAYRDMLQWDYQAQHQLSPGQGILFRPWLFHSLDHGLVQIFKLRELSS